MDLAALKAEYDELGFVVIRSFLAGESLDQLCQQLDRYIRDVVPSAPQQDVFYDDRARPETLRQLHRMEQDAYFAAYLRHPSWVQVASTLLGEPVQAAQGAEWFNKPVGSLLETPPHQDNFYFCLDPPSVLTMWLALEQVEERNGCLRYVPGSHRAGMRPHGMTRTLGFSQGISDFGDADRAIEVAVTAAPGDVLIHHGNTIHRAEANRSTSRSRRSFAMVFRGSSCRQDEAALERYRASVRSQQRDLLVEN